jgi:predicted Fe-Mo cluster-binding NifX family protein
MNKIAIPVTGGNQVDEHFGHCEHFKVFTISDEKRITGEKIVKSAEGCGCKSDISSVLANDGVTIMLAGGIGNGAINALANAGIEVIRGCSGDVETVVNQYISGLISDSGENCKQHEEHHTNGHNHTCKH